MSESIYGIVCVVWGDSKAECASTSPSALVTEAVDEIHERVLVIGTPFISGVDDMTGRENKRFEPPRQ